MKKELQTAIDVLMKNIDELTPEMQSAVKTVLAAVSDSTSESDLPNEEWRDVVGYEGFYQVSNLGRVRSVKLIKPSFHKSTGYKRLMLTKNGKRKNFHVHQLVAKNFTPNPLNKPVINHKDGDKTNNCVENLEWNTYGENNRHAWNMGLITPKKSIACW